MALLPFLNRSTETDGATEIKRPQAAAPRSNVLDKAVTFFAPRAGVRRMAARSVLALYGSYTGARVDRKATKDWFTSWGSADADINLDLFELRKRSRDLVRNEPIATGAINTVTANVVGTGLSLQATPDAKTLKWSDDKARAWADNVEREYKLWAESVDCDATRTQNFYGLTDLAFRSFLESGDVFGNLPFIQRDKSPYSLAIQVIEADRVRNPYGLIDGGAAEGAADGLQCWQGVEVDDAGAPSSYIVFRKHPGAPDFLKSGLKWDRLSAFGQRTGRRNVVHLFDRRRPEQKRGVPYLSPVIELIKQLGRYTDAEVTAAVLNAMFTVFVKTELGTSGLGQQPESKNPAKDPNTEYKLGTGTMIDLAQGEDVTFADPKRPNQNFDPFVISILRQVGVALELPFEILVKHFTASYSAARGAMLEAWKFYRNRRAFLSTGWCQPIYEAWMEEAVAIGRIAAPGFFADPIMRRAYVSAEWIGDAPGQIDPQKEAQAAQTRVDMGISTLKDETMAITGKVWDSVHKQRALEHKMRVADGLEAEIPDPATATTTADNPVKGKPPNNDQESNGKPDGSDSDLEKS